ncbi:MAG: GAF domain-containing protein, partial [Candidatus Methanoperedens sp.]
MENIEEKSKLKALSDIASIDISLEFNDILHKILKITCQGTGAKSGTIMLVDELDNNIRMVASYGLPQNYIERVYEAAKKAGVEISSSPSGTVLETGNYYLVPNTFEEPKNKPFNDLPRELGFSSMIYTPMKKGLKVIGLLNAYWADPRQFTDEEINFVSIAASQASSVVQNARLCGRLKHNVRELKQYKENLEDKIKETHKKLYDSERYLRTIIDSSFDGILVVDEEGRFEFGNDSAFNILGWPREELIGQFFMKVFPVDMEEFMLDRWHDIQNGNETPYETSII